MTAMTAINKIADILDCAPRHFNFEFEGRHFEYHPASSEHKTAETLYTRWADGLRSASPLHIGDTVLRQQLAALLAHSFRKAPSPAECEAVIARARAALG